MWERTGRGQSEPGEKEGEGQVQKTMRMQGETPSHRPEVRRPRWMDTPQVFGVRSANCQRQQSLIFSRENKDLPWAPNQQSGVLRHTSGLGSVQIPGLCREPRVTGTVKKRRICSSCSFVPHRARGFPEQGVGGMRGPPHSTFHRAAVTRTHAPALGQRDLRSKCPRRLGAVPRRESRT